MGYTHYWKTLKEFSPTQWDRLTLATKSIIKQANAQGIKIAGSDGTGKPKISSDSICLNGQGEDDSHETFHLARNPTEFEFCKTAEKPYDSVVVSILAKAKEIAGDNIELSSDGGEEVFKNACFN